MDPNGVWSNTQFRSPTATVVTKRTPHFSDDISATYRIVEWAKPFSIDIGSLNVFIG